MNMKIEAAILLICVTSLFIGGCTSLNQDEELRSAITDSTSAIMLKLEDIAQGDPDIDLEWIQRGTALETESQIWYDKISAIDDISPEWHQAKINQLKALEYFGTGGKQISDAARAHQRGDYSISEQYLEEAAISLTKATRYIEETKTAIPE